MTSQLLDRHTYRLIGAAMRVHTALGGGMLERVYARAMAVELRWCRIPFVEHPPLQVTYRGVPIGTYEPDLICFDDIVVELKAASELASAHLAQTLHYLMARGATRALLINFGRQRLEWKRFARGVMRAPEAADK